MFIFEKTKIEEDRKNTATPFVITAKWCFVSKLIIDKFMRMYYECDENLCIKCNINKDEISTQTRI